VSTEWRASSPQSPPPPVVTVALWYDWRLAFYGLALASAASTVVFVALARRTDLPDAGAGDTDFAGALSEWKLILAGVVLMGLTSFVWQGLFNFYELYMVDKGLPPGGAEPADGDLRRGRPGVSSSPATSPTGSRTSHTYSGSCLCSSSASSPWSFPRAGCCRRRERRRRLRHPHAVSRRRHLPARVAAGRVPSVGVRRLLPGMMTTQAAGSWVVGEAIEAGAGYDAVFSPLAGDSPSSSSPTRWCLSTPGAFRGAAGTRSTRPDRHGSTGIAPI